VGEQVSVSLLFTIVSIGALILSASREEFLLSRVFGKGPCACYLRKETEQNGTEFAIADAIRAGERLRATAKLYDFPLDSV
jgi:hypothetical protein